MGWHRGWRLLDTFVRPHFQEVLGTGVVVVVVVMVRVVVRVSVLIRQRQSLAL